MATQTPMKGKEVNSHWGIEETYGVAPDGVDAVWFKAPFYSSSLKPTEPLEPDPILGVPRNNDVDATDPAPGLETHGGDHVFPLDLGVMPLLAHAMFGPPVTTGVAPDLVHTYKSGSRELPTFLAEFPFGRTAPTVFHHHGLGLSRAQFQIRREAGYRRVTTTWIGQRTTRPLATVAPVDMVVPTLDAVPASFGGVRINGTQVGNLIEASLQYDTGLTPKDYVTPQAYIDGLERGNDATCTGSLSIRFANADFYDLALSGAFLSLDFEYAKSAARSALFAMPRVRLSKTGPEITGPGGIEARFDFSASQSLAVPMLSLVLKTAQAALGA